MIDTVQLVKKFFLPIFWTETILFQKLQRHIHDEINESEYLNFVIKFQITNHL